MRLKNKLITSLCGVLAIAFTGCATNEVRVIEGSQERTVTEPLVAPNTPQIVHIDLFSRIATIRNGVALSSDYLISTNYAGVETAVLKSRPNQGMTLLTADILEGEPEINNTVKAAGSARSMELAKLYSIVVEEN